MDRKTVPLYLCVCDRNEKCYREQEEEETRGARALLAHRTADDHKRTSSLWPGAFFTQERFGNIVLKMNLRRIFLVKCLVVLFFCVKGEFAPAFLLFQAGFA